VDWRFDAKTVSAFMILVCATTSLLSLSSHLYLLLSLCFPFFPLSVKAAKQSRRFGNIALPPTSHQRKMWPLSRKRLLLIKQSSSNKPPPAAALMEDVQTILKVQSAKKAHFYAVDQTASPKQPCKKTRTFRRRKREVGGLSPRSTTSVVTSKTLKACRSWSSSQSLSLVRAL